MLVLILLFLSLLGQNPLCESFVPIPEEDSADISRTCGFRPGYRGHGVKIFDGEKAKPMQFPWVIEIAIPCKISCD